MTFRQSLMKTIYPGIMAIVKWVSGKYSIRKNKFDSKPLVSFYKLQAETIEGKIITLSKFKGKKILLVNTASDCGYTRQYEELEKLHRQHSDKVIILGFPANNFKEQEKSNDADIANFCKKNFGVTFILIKKSSVIKDNQQNNVYRWLTDAGKNGWNNKQPEWNFSKYLVNEEGILTHYFPPAISPLSKEVKEHL